jgi:hypothetical protein
LHAFFVDESPGKRFAFTLSQSDPSSYRDRGDGAIGDVDPKFVPFEQHAPVKGLINSEGLR